MIGEWKEWHNTASTMHRATLQLRTGKEGKGNAFQACYRHIERLRHRPPLPLRKYSWYSFLLEAESTPRVIVRPEELCK